VIPCGTRVRAAAPGNPDVDGLALADALLPDTDSVIVGVPVALRLRLLLPETEEEAGRDDVSGAGTDTDDTSEATGGTDDAFIAPFPKNGPSCANDVGAALTASSPRVVATGESGEPVMGSEESRSVAVDAVAIVATARFPTIEVPGGEASAVGGVPASVAAEAREALLVAAGADANADEAVELSAVPSGNNTTLEDAPKLAGAPTLSDAFALPITVLSSVKKIVGPLWVSPA